MLCLPGNAKFTFGYLKNVSEETQEMPQSRSTASPRHQTKNRNKQCRRRTQSFATSTIYCKFKTLQLFLSMCVCSLLSRVILFIIYLSSPGRPLSGYRPLAHPPPPPNRPPPPTHTPIPIPSLTPRGNFVYYNFLKLHNIRNKIIHVSPLAMGVFACKSHVNNVTLKTTKNT